jgi:hypothetical protein
MEVPKISVDTWWSTLNEQFPELQVGRGDPQNSSLRSPALTPLAFHKNGLWTQSKKKEKATPSDFRCCKTRQSWFSNIIISATTGNGTYFVTFLAWNDLKNKTL